MHLTFFIIFRYTFTTIPNTAVNMPANLYEAGDTHAQAMEWMRNYGKFNAGNLHTQDVLRVIIAECNVLLLCYVFDSDCYYATRLILST